MEDVNEKHFVQQIVDHVNKKQKCIEQNARNAQYDEIGYF